LFLCIFFLKFEKRASAIRVLYKQWHAARVVVVPPHMEAMLLVLSCRCWVAAAQCGARLGCCIRRDQSVARGQIWPLLGGDGGKATMVSGGGNYAEKREVFFRVILVWAQVGFLNPNGLGPIYFF
jgi:hypothetical protein